MKLLVKKKNGKVHIREKSQESLETLPEVHPNKISSWLALAEASMSARDESHEDVIQAVIDKCRGGKIRLPEPKIEVTEAEYIQLCKQAYKKRIEKEELDRLVVVMPLKKIDLFEEVLLSLH